MIRPAWILGPQPKAAQRQYAVRFQLAGPWPLGTMWQWE